MEAQTEHTAEEVKHLRRCINDLVGVVALPAVWGAGEPAEIVRTLLEALPRMLDLDLIYMRLGGAAGGASVETARVAQSANLTAGPREVGGLLERWLGSDPQAWPALARGTVGGSELTVVSLGLGLQGEVGVLVAGSRREDFPRQTERLVLSVAANQAAIGLQQSRLLSEERRAADEHEHQRAEEALAASERNLKLTIDTIPTLAWSTGPDGRADFFNQHYLDFVGLSTEQVAGWGWTVALHPDDRDGLAATWERILAAGEPGAAEARIRRHDGEYRWFLQRANPMRDESGNIVKWYGTNTDIDDLKRAEAQRDRTIEELKAKQELLDLAQKSARAIAFDWYVHREVNVWSPEQEALYGLPPGGFDGTYQSWKRLIYAPDWPPVLKAIKHAQETGEVAVEFRVVWPDGSLHWLSTNGRMFFDGQGRPFRMVGFTSDVTPRKLAEEDLRRLRTELAHVSRVATLGALTASIAHEVNQPLSGIITNASTCLRMLAADPPNVEGARETARRTIRDGHRAADVITRLRALFGKQGAAAEPVDLNEAAREVVALSLSELQRGRVILRTELAEDLPPVAGDRVQLQQVILNLLRNASDAMSGVEDRPRQLLVRTERDEGERVRLSVRDAGVGFDPRGVERLFEAFYTTKDDGMGIGLSVSRSIIESHQGRLWATPNEGPGATFSFSIPQASGVGASPPHDSADAERPARDA